MKATAKYLFDEDFAAGEKPTITMVEHEPQASYVESRPMAGRSRHIKATQRMADAPP